MSLRSWVCRLETVRRHVRRAEADRGVRPDLPSSAEREQITQLKRENARAAQGERDSGCCKPVFAGEPEVFRGRGDRVYRSEAR